jgi:hypothetical protein
MLRLTKASLITVFMALLLIFCITGAVWTVYWSLWFGLAPRPPLSLFQIVLRFVVVISAIVLIWRRHDLLERSALACAVIAAGSSALYGLGMDSETLQVVRLLFHFLGYSLGAVAITRWLLAARSGKRSPAVVTL